MIKIGITIRQWVNHESMCEYLVMKPSIPMQSRKRRSRKAGVVCRQVWPTAWWRGAAPHGCRSARDLRDAAVPRWADGGGRTGGGCRRCASMRRRRKAAPGLPLAVRPCYGAAPGRGGGDDGVEVEDAVTGGDGEDGAGEDGGARWAGDFFLLILASNSMGGRDR